MSTHIVLVNCQEQYAIVKLSFPLPPGWTAAGFEGDEQACAEWVDRTWTDMVPASLRSSGRRVDE